MATKQAAKQATRQFSARFQAECAGRTMDIAVRPDRFACDGRVVPFSYERLGPARIALLLGGKSYVATALEASGDRWRIGIGGQAFEVTLKDDRALLFERFGFSGGPESDLLKICAPMPGMVLSVAAAPGAVLEAGTGVLVLEAMKMENELRTERAGTVQAVHVAPGDTVGKGDLLLEIA